MLIRSFLVAVVFLASLLACSSGAGIQFRLDDQYSYFTVSMTEQQVRDAVLPLLAASPDLTVRDATIDLQPGLIRVTGTLVTNQGNYQGNMSIAMWAEQNGRLGMAVRDFAFAGYNAPSEHIASFNRDLAAGLERDHQQRDNDSVLTEVQITNDNVSMTWRTPREDR